MSLLCERDDFPELLAAAAEHYGIHNVAILEKDYYVTEALRAIAASFGEVTIFKGGTSLSKGWRIIDRFSEDIDLYIDRKSRGTKATNTLLKSLASCVGTSPSLSIDEVRTQRIDGAARATTYRYRSALGALGGISPTVLLEAGIQSGTYPTEIRPLRSMLAEFLDAQRVHLDTADFAPFEMRLLHFRRTFVEKLFAIHHKVERDMLQLGRPLGTYARHYYDLAQLIRRPEVRDMLGTNEYLEIAADYQRLTQSFLPGQLLPPRMSLSQSQALYPSRELATLLERAYQSQCEILCYGAFPPFHQVLADFAEIRHHLVEIQK